MKWYFITQKDDFGKVPESARLELFYKVLELEKTRLAGTPVSGDTIRRVFDDIVTPDSVVRLNKLKHDEAMARKADKIKGKAN